MPRLLHVSTLLFCATLLVACSTTGRTPDPPGDTAVWVAKRYSLGQQCTDETFSAPSPEQELASAGVRVLAEHIEPMMVCAACSCPAYAAVHYARIGAADLDRALGAGFERSEGPPTP